MADLKEQARRREEDEQAASDWRAVLRSVEGRRAVAWLLRTRCEVFGVTYVPGGLDAQRHTAFNLGRRFVGLELCQIGGVDLAAGLKQLEDQVHDDAKRERAGSGNAAERIAASIRDAAGGDAAE